MAAEYPAAIPTIAANKQDDVNAITGADAGTTTNVGDHAAHHNKLAEEVVALATELGIDPSGDFTSVAEKLSSLIARERGARLIDLDFLSTPTASSDPVRIEISGAGANGLELEGEQGAPGIVQLSTGTTATGRSAVRTTALSGVKFGGGKWIFETRVRINTLSTAAERYALRAGFIDSTTGDSTDGAYFEYDESVSANWRLKTSNNGTRTTVDSGIAVAAAAWITLRVCINAAGTQADYYLNGTLVTDGTPAPITTNIPTAAGRATGIGVMVLKSIGLTTRTFDVDYLFTDAFLTTQR